MTQMILEFFSALGLWAIPLSFLFTVLLNLLGVIPSIFVTGINIILWGPWWGFLLSWLSELVGSSLAFWLYRKGVQQWKGEKKGNWRWIQKCNSLPRGKQQLSLLTVRLAPFFPSGVVNVAGAFTNVRLIDFIWTTGIGKIPSITLEVVTFLGFQQLGRALQWTILGLVVVGIVLWWYSKKKQAVD
ncbi:putative membrane protein YdjX (TVP38/TMEM64 family) [Croceifilum oryzae]|uniref:TVP38/TMEM64 family membrane protein n=2 Tax=Croceifilum oryzae TaxID=1553429 RepID=A0AAJ1TKR7_9BACL|nr:putative membrane protein YdjX (TVP38/TMEM64 family) [Croceifilum oryzae]